MPVSPSKNVARAITRKTVLPSCVVTRDGRLRVGLSEGTLRDRRRDTGAGPGADLVEGQLGDRGRCSALRGDDRLGEQRPDDDGEKPCRRGERLRREQGEEGAEEPDPHQVGPPPGAATLTDRPHDTSVRQPDERRHPEHRRADRAGVEVQPHRDRAASEREDGEHDASAAPVPLSGAERGHLVPPRAVGLRRPSFPWCVQSSRTPGPGPDAADRATGGGCRSHYDRAGEQRRDPWAVPALQGRGVRGGPRGEGRRDRGTRRRVPGALRGGGALGAVARRLHGARVARRVRGARFVVRTDDPDHRTNRDPSNNGCDEPVCGRGVRRPSRGRSRR